MRKLQLAVLLQVLTLSTLAAQEGSPPLKRPNYQILPQNEDWSVLAGRDAAETGNWFDPIKYIPINEEGSIWFSFGGSVRFRFENHPQIQFRRAPRGPAQR